MNKQILNARLRFEYFYNGNWINFFGFPTDLRMTNGNIKNVNAVFFKGTNATDEALSGALRSNLRGFRPKFEFSYNDMQQPDLFYRVMGILVIGSRKIVAETTTANGGTSSTSLVVTDPVMTTANMNGLKINVNSTGETTATRVSDVAITLGATRVWAIDQPVIIYAEADFPIRAWLRPDATVDYEIEVIFDSAMLETAIEYTITKRPANLTFKAKNILDSIPILLQ